MTTVQDFLSDNQVTGALTPEQAAQLLELPHQGETVSATEPADPPVSAPAPEPSPDAAETKTTTDEPTADNAVILAKDGKHIIPFDKLAEARDSAQQAAAERDAALRREAELRAQLEAAQRQPAAPAATQPAATEGAVDLKTLRAEHIAALVSGEDDKALELAEKIDAEVQRLAEDRIMRRLASERAQEQAVTAADALQQTATSLKAKYPALDDSGADADPEAIEFVVYKRDALIASGEAPHKALEQAVEKAAAMFKWNGQQPAAQQPDARGAAAAAAKAIAAAKAPTPATLSDIPGGKPAGQTLEVQMAAKSGPEMLEVMQGMTRDQIEDFMNRTI